MPQVIRHKRLRGAGAVPAANLMQVGEIVVNYDDGKAYTKLASGEVVLLNGSTPDPQPQAVQSQPAMFITGKWTPVIKGDTTDPTVTYDVSGTKGKYTKVGNVVYIQGQVTLTAATGGSGYVYIGGLPFSPTNVAGLAIANYDNWATYVPEYCQVNTAGRILFRRSNTASGTGLLDCSHITATMRIFFSGTYMTNDTEPAS